MQVKGGDWREQPLTQTITGILEREREMAQDQEGWIFPSRRTATGHMEGLRVPFRRAVRAAGLNPETVTPHTMRHTAITEMAEAGAEPRTIQAFSGHKSQAMVWRYTHARDQRIDEALDRFDSGRTKVERIDRKKRPRS
ncbi:MAG: tyrosine-type recombinase/integrase [Proteobacteria bacterium]|nr:tyrosine-type recombinase/integrase [Pseudomonadota bacterium]